MNDLGKWIMGLGVALVAVGALLQVPKLFGWVGRLPGDVRVGNTTILIGTSVVLSLILTLMLNLLGMFLRRR